MRNYLGEFCHYKGLMLKINYIKIKEPGEEIIYNTKLSKDYLEKLSESVGRVRRIKNKKFFDKIKNSKL